MIKLLNSTDGCSNKLLHKMHNLFIPAFFNFFAIATLAQKN
jgi:hypothetical protein